MSDEVYVELDERRPGRILIRAAFWRREQCEQIPGSSWDEERDVWTVPQAWTACLALRGTFAEALELGPRLTEWATQERQSRVLPCREGRLILEGPGDPRLRPFQRGDVLWMRVARRCILANGTGSGKTVSTVTALKELGTVPAVVYCPKNMVLEWARHLARWGDPSWVVRVVSGGVVDRRKALQPGADVYVMHYDVALKHSRLAPYGNIRLSQEERAPKELNQLPLRAVICDEAHLLANPQAKRTRALWATAHQSTVEAVFALTATPLTNDMSSTWSVLHLISPQEWPAKTKFIDRYVEKGWNMWGGEVLLSVRPDTAGEFFAGFEPRFRCVPQEVALPMLPPVTREIRMIDMEGAQLKAYKQLMKDMIVELESGRVLSATYKIQQTTRARQLASAMIDLIGANEVVLKTPSNKVDALLELLEELPRSESLVVFAEHRKLIDLASQVLTKKRIEHSLVVGGQSVEDRQQEVDLFQAGKRRVLLATIAAGGTGLTLTRARFCVYLQRHASMVLNVQADGRVRRIGSEMHDRIVYIEFQSRGTTDSRMLELMTLKRRRLEDLVQEEELLRQLLDGQDTPVEQQVEIQALIAQAGDRALTYEGQTTEATE